MRIETFVQLINIGAGRQFTVSKAHQRKARNRYAQGVERPWKLLSLCFKMTVTMTEQLQTDTQADRRKRKFSFFASALLKRKLQPHIWHIAFCPPTHKPDRWAKVKEPNFTDTQSMQ